MLFRGVRIILIEIIIIYKRSERKGWLTGGQPDDSGLEKEGEENDRFYWCA